MECSAFALPVVGLNEEGLRLDGGLGGIELRGRVGFSFVNEARGFRVSGWGRGTGGGLALSTNR
jgi:hypothetical protein